MIPRIKKISVLDDYILFVEFDDGYKVLYDVKDDIKTLPSFRALMDVYGLFKQARLDSSRTCVYWNYIGMTKSTLPAIAFMNTARLHNFLFGG